ncbi:MAG TPA: carboxypeptidase M32 [Candidatus Kapabacteria bacterium]|jgi:carboxypeptidase Taq|nr:carboxypeptidase M32 [Candidatus Kapabacteria bacterium]
MATPVPFDSFLETYRTMADLSAASAALHWDQETHMPPRAASGRAEQIATVDSLVHRMATSTEYATVLTELEGMLGNGALETWQKRAVKEAVRAQRRAAKLPEEFVHELSKTQSLSQHAWKQAREAADFSMFADTLAKLVELKRREAAYLGEGCENLYDALIDDFEPGMTVAQLRPVFERLKSGTRLLLDRVRDAGAKPDKSFWLSRFEAERQLAFATNLVGQLGFSFESGRVDLSTHPFCTSFGVDDVRLTTRIRENEPAACIFGLIHEAGHGMYEQGFDRAYVRTPVGQAISMGIHESQSLFWENMIGRGEPFWNWAFPRLAEAFPENMRGRSPRDMYRAVNVMEPSFIRVEADELTYNLHIVMRFEIEEALINGTMEASEIPVEWNKRMEQYLGVVPPNDALGALQDVHWSFGLFGYFPSYTLGKLYAAMFHNQMAREIPDLDGVIARGEFAVVLSWLREKIHRWGRLKSADELVRDVCGRPLTETDFLEYISRKIDSVYR